MATLFSEWQSLTAAPELPKPALFKSFWMGGFESACHINTVRERLDMIASTQHDVQVRSDYALLRDRGIRTVRDGVRWHLIEKRPGVYDFSSLTPMLKAAHETGTQVIWNVCHYGWPDDLDVNSRSFITRYARFCRAVAEHVAEYTPGPRFFTPMNEISYLSWAIGYKGTIYPYAAENAHELKKHLIRAVIEGINQIWDVDPAARISHVDPVIHVVTPRGRPDLAEAALAQRNAQFAAWDMLSGRLHPELGGEPKYLDVVGVNYYHSNQFEHPDVRLRWEDEPRDERFVPFHELLREVYERYKRPFFIAETSHFGEGRAKWILEIAEEICSAREKRIPVEGVCLYPVLDRHDWESKEHWHNSGLFDLKWDRHGTLRRVLDPAYGEALERAQARLARLGCA